MSRRTQKTIVHFALCKSYAKLPSRKDSTTLRYFKNLDSVMRNGRIVWERYETAHSDQFVRIWIDLPTITLGSK